MRHGQQQAIESIAKIIQSRPVMFHAVNILKIIRPLHVNDLSKFFFDPIELQNLKEDCIIRSDIAKNTAGPIPVCHASNSNASAAATFAVFRQRTKRPLRKDIMMIVSGRLTIPTFFETL